MKFKEFELLIIGKWIIGMKKMGTVDLLQFTMNGMSDNIPLKIFNKFFLLEQIHLFYSLMSKR